MRGTILSQNHLMYARCPAIHATEMRERKKAIWTQPILAR